MVAGRVRPWSSRQPSRATQSRFRTEDVERLRQAADLRQAGILSEDEFARVKEVILSGWTAAPPSSATPPYPAQSTSVTEYVGTQYAVIVRDLGSADPARVRKILRSHLDDFPADRLETMPCTVAEGIGFATAEPLRADLAKAGASVEMLER